MTPLPNLDPLPLPTGPDPAGANEFQSLLGSASDVIDETLTSIGGHLGSAGQALNEVTAASQILSQDLANGLARVGELSDAANALSVDDKLNAALSNESALAGHAANVVDVLSSGPDSVSLPGVPTIGEPPVAPDLTPPAPPQCPEGQTADPFTGQCMPPPAPPASGGEEGPVGALGTILVLPHCPPGTVFDPFSFDCVPCIDALEFFDTIRSDPFILGIPGPCSEAVPGGELPPLTPFLPF